MDRSPRILPGADNDWVVAQRGILRVAHHLVVEGALVPRAMERLEVGGMLHPLAPSTYSATVLTTLHCNLRCSYCFQNVGGLDVGGAPRRVAPGRSPLRATEIVDFITRRTELAGKDGCSVVLFGGEPLLQAAGCLRILDGLAPVLHRAGLVTNGTLLTASTARDLEEAGLVAVQITLDGDRDSHDGFRSTRAGKGTYDLILANVKELLATTALQIHLRVNVSASTLQGLGGLVDDVVSILPAERLTVGLAPIRDYSWNQNERSARGPALELVRCAATRLHDHGVALALPPARSCPYCQDPAGIDGGVIGPDGSLYSCCETAGRPEMQVGTIDAGYDTEAAKDGRWVSCVDNFEQHAADRSMDYVQAFEGAILDVLFGGREGKPVDLFH